MAACLTMQEATSRLPVVLFVSTLSHGYMYTNMSYRLIVALFVFKGPGCKSSGDSSNFPRFPQDITLTRLSPSLPLSLLPLFLYLPLSLFLSSLFIRTGKRIVRRMWSYLLPHFHLQWKGERNGKEFFVFR